MIGENGEPVTPDWTPHPAAERCLDCQRIRVYCEAVGGCCAWCSHKPSAALTAPLGWEGDQA